MIRKILILVLCLLPGAAWALGPETALSADQVLRGRFHLERHLQGFRAPLQSEGVFLLAPGKGLIWQAEKPFAIRTVITPSGLAQDVGGSETMRLPSTRLPFLSKLYDMLGGALGGDWAALERDFVVEKSGDGAAWQVSLTPRQGSDPMAMPFSAIVARGGRFVESVTVAKAEGDHDDITFLDQKVSASPLAAEESAALGAPAR